MTPFISKKRWFSMVPWLVPLALNALSLATGPAARAADLDPADTAEPYYPVEDGATSFTLLPEEYNDLKAYLDLAKDTLTDTIEDTRKLGGARAHARLLQGALDAIRQGGFKYQLMLFRHVLERAVDVDRIYLQGIENLDTIAASERYDAANQMLLLNIANAVHYYNGIHREFTAEVIEVPDWVSFARANIPLFEHQINLAPNPRAMKEITLRALGWTARALNTSLERKEQDIPRAILNLMTAQEQLRKDAVTVNHSLQILFEVGELLRARAGIDAPSGQVPGAAFPKADLSARVKRPSVSFFPLIKSGLGSELAWVDDDVVIRLPLALGGGGAALAETHQDTTYFGQLCARVGFMLTAGENIGRADGDFTPLQGNLYLGARGDLSLADIPVHRLKASAGASIVGFVGGWLGIEANRYRTIQETLLRGGWGPLLTVRIDKRSYVLVRGGIGASKISIESRQRILTRKGTGLGQTFAARESMTVEGDQALAIEAATVIKLGGVVIQVEGNYDSNKPDEGGLLRLSLGADVTLPLRIVTENSAINLRGDFTRYDFDDKTGLKDVNVGTAGASYQLRW